MNPWFTFLLSALATYRLALMTSSEDGPAFIFRKLRRVPDAKKHPAVKKGLSCELCTSVYFAALVAGYDKWAGWVSWELLPIYWLALSAVAVIFHMAFTKDF